MPEPGAGHFIPQDVMLARLAQSEQMREFFIEMWRQNPSLAAQGGAKVQQLLMPLAEGDAALVCGDVPHE